MTNEELQSKTITWLRFPLAVAIVFIHTNMDEISPAVAHIDYFHPSGMDIYNVIHILLSVVLLRVATPCFCIFSGFLFFYKTKNVWNRNIYFRQIKRKTRTLIAPYVLWNIIPVVIMVLFCLVKFDGSLSVYLYELQENGIFRIFWNCKEGLYPYNIPLWFLRDLIIVAFLSPIVYYFIKYFKLYSIFILVFFYFTDIWFPVISVRAFFFFSLGAYFSIHGKNMIIELRKSKWFWLFSAIITLVLSMYFEGTDKFRYLYIMYNVSGSITTINIASWLIKRGHVSVHPFLSKTSFFIFALHGVYLLWQIQKLLNILFHSNNAFILTMEYFLAPIICVCVCLGLYYIAQRTVPRLLGILTGSR